ncbi:Pimeloyl-ACP methyl ester carboxylesterase [Marinococcus luteus]|uniref:Pimeloyl-ACP methyl ester carboxylesterase n=1 Tax=Marinococcus luteus TaxID=1122204 RepID=A0A1H2TAI8_9BACI|nr:alpha/beta hydrolase [Marinococcus luteus]SDW40963.1 Pimeloyl-ACP methyl ester carboxylesterase [Marinococcus luteus]
MERTLGMWYRKDGTQMEYTICGTGEPVLVMHGGHSNCMEEMGYAPLVRRGYRLITPSRPGYRATSAEIGGSLESAAEAYAGLLDYLQIESVHVLAVSAGGPSGLMLASAYPERVRTLTLESAVTTKWLTKKDAAYKAAMVLFRPKVEKGTWALLRMAVKKRPEMIFKQMAASFSTLSYEHIRQEINSRALQEFAGMIAGQRSGKGFLIDVNTKAAEEMWTSIHAPVLIVHSEHDASVPVQHAHQAKRLMPQAELTILESWGHLIWIGSKAQNRDHAVLNFLKKNRL